ncbi:hypothetical protein TGAM01_v210507 [Trichoderma gamsii]|uniref:Uncharacterized protein n=1 Tax=Trichoderma gamsii TaxID=398673 RepID=A0A2P4Z8M4_9HYPO|nr:hypothetical protein TGAM01_v210507 [Trichoderma gamsii]PON20633.1 hypothetical protein TGAM01_v210507 [Trichoderma gamsii]
MIWSLLSARCLCFIKCLNQVYIQYASLRLPFFSLVSDLATRRAHHSLRLPQLFASALLATTLEGIRFRRN